MTLRVCSFQAARTLQKSTASIPMQTPSNISPRDNPTLNYLQERMSTMAEKIVKDVGFKSNMEVDYVISYRFATTGRLVRGKFD